MVSADATRPVTLLLGQGCRDAGLGRPRRLHGPHDGLSGVRESRDVLVNYTYPLNNGHPRARGPTGIDNLNRYAELAKPIIADLEASESNGEVRPTPHDA